MGSGSDSLTAGQMRAARGLLDMKQAELATAAGVSVETIKRMEAFGGAISANPLSLRAVRQALEVRGVRFLFDDGVAAGVRIGDGGNATSSGPSLFELLTRFYELVMADDATRSSYDFKEGQTPRDLAIYDMRYEGLPGIQNLADSVRGQDASPELQAVADQIFRLLDYPEPPTSERKGRGRR